MKTDHDLADELRVNSELYGGIHTLKFALFNAAKFAWKTTSNGLAIIGIIATALMVIGFWASFVLIIMGKA